MGDDGKTCFFNYSVYISIHVPRMGDDPSYSGDSGYCFISIHVPRMGDDVDNAIPTIWSVNISIHVPRMGDDRPPNFRVIHTIKFLSTSPVWGTTLVNKSIQIFLFHFYPRPPYGGRLARLSWTETRCYFYPRPPYGGRRQSHSRPSHRTDHFYPRPPYGGRPATGHTLKCLARFLSTSPVWGTTQCVASACETIVAFLSTSPVWGTTHPHNHHLTTWKISIHVPRMGDDTTTATIQTTPKNFYPRPPYGGRQILINCFTITRGFLSTSPVWGTTGGKNPWHCWSLYFYPRPPYGGRPSNHVKCLCTIFYFYPRPPYGGRPPGASIVHCPLSIVISIHVPRMGDDLGKQAGVAASHVFLSTSPVWGTTGKFVIAAFSASVFLSTSPVWGTTGLTDV